MQQHGPTNYSTPPYFTMKINAQVTIKNTNFGKFEFDNSTATISFGGFPVGRAVIGKGKAKARSTKRVDVSVSLSSNNVLPENYELRYNFDLGKLRLTSQGTLKGKVYLLKVIKRKKSAEMNCYMEVNIKTKKIENLHCGKCAYGC
ncbi:hypothetical protein Vadar_012328 [Vaccinium darrowii]|uniref:Uncharacterized protein n=1 Tax=Vaccinium darrowii TaxID=229202 RepID=A0ACB7XGX8_9ERIC|nr:hypothetical protein Vadar_012328 [Vaccinium darrowii]